MQPDDPETKLLMRFSKAQIKVLAEELGLSTEGSKIDLACKVAEKQKDETDRIWRAIIG